MSTQVIILGKENAKLPKPIEFCEYIDASGRKSIATNIPAQFKTIELIRKSPSNKYDMMFAYNDNRNEGTLYLGYFNDGIVK